MRLRIHLLLFTLLAALFLTACGGANTPSAESNPAPAAEADPVPGAEADPEASGPEELDLSSGLVIYSGRSETLIQPIIDRFETETGIEVAVRYGSTSEMAGVLLEEGANSPADLYYAQDPGGLGAVQAAGLLRPLPESVLGRVPERFRSDNGEWIGISGRARVIVYNTAAISDPATDLPADIYDFVDPKWSGRLGWAPTNASFQAMVTAMRVLWGEDKTRQWLEGVQANGPLVFAGNTQVVDAVGAGEIDAGFVNHYYLYRFLAEQGESFPARNYFLPGGGPGSLILVSGVGILKSADHPDNAQRFVEFLLSAEGQQYFADETFEYPVIDGVTLPDMLPPLAELDAQAVHVPLSDLADVAGTQDLLIDLGIIE